MSRALLVAFVGIAAVALLLASIALLVWVTSPGDRTQPVAPADGAVAVGDPKAPRGGKRFTLRLGQGFRFKDGVVVVKPDDGPDIVFKYVPPQLGGAVMKYDPLKQRVEQKMEPTITSPVPLLLSTHVNVFEEKPSVARTTSGDMASYDDRAPIGPKARYVLLQNQAGDQYLLTLDELEAPPGKYDDWRVGFAYEKIQLPVGLAGGKINKPLPGKIIFRDWFRTKIIVGVDLTTGKEEAVVDGFVPTTVGGRLLGYADATGDYVVRDAAGKILKTIRFNDTVHGPVLSPDGTRVLISVNRPGAPVPAGLVTIAGPDVMSSAVFDLEGQEIVSIPGYDDATWTPDGKLIATGKLNEPGLFEIDPATKNVRPIDATVAYPYQPCVAPDGKTIAFVTGNKVWLIDRDGKNRRQLFQDGKNQQRPVFSPDGTKVAMIICNHFATDVSGDVFVIDLKTHELTPLRTNTGSSLVPDTATRLNWIP